MSLWWEDFCAAKLHRESFNVVKSLTYSEIQDGHSEFLVTVHGIRAGH
jgi:hypothetical protein